MFKRNLLDPDSLVEQAEKIDPNLGLPCRGDFRPPVMDVHILQGDQHVWKKPISKRPPTLTSIPITSEAAASNRGL